MDIHDMKQNERRYYTEIGAEVIRVPGGWIYKFKEVDRMAKHAVVMNAVFVPLSDEFGAETAQEKSWSELWREKGATAFRHGKTMGDCPHTDDNPAYFFWRAGHRAAENKAKEALNKGEST